MKLSFYLLISLFAFKAFAFNEVVNGEELRSRLKLLGSNSSLSNIKVAILDNGFKGFDPKKGMLPENAELVEGPLKIPSMASHGLGMAQIVWEMTGKTAEGPKFYLVNANGFTNFKAAVDFVIKNQVDIVLYSQIWNFGSNFDGKGFINEVVNKALSAGIIWINAAGNLGKQVYNGEMGAGEHRFRLENKLDDNSVTLTLTWADFYEREDVCTNQDFDFEVYDSHEKLMKSGNLIQGGVAPDSKNPKDNRSCYARESISLENLERGFYSIKVISKAQKTLAYKVLMTETRIGTFEFPESNGPEIMPPADNAGVLTVGERTEFSAAGTTADGRMKPDVVVANARVDFTNGSQTAGSSNAAAMIAGAVTLLKAHDESLDLKRLLSYTKKLRTKLVIPAELVRPSNVSDWVRYITPVGGMVRQDPGTGRLVILSRELPVKLPMLQRFNLRTNQTTDIVACLENMSSCSVFPVKADFQIKTPYIEFRQYVNGTLSDEAPVWITPNQNLE